MSHVCQRGIKIIITQCSVLPSVNISVSLITFPYFAHVKPFHLRIFGGPFWKNGREGMRYSKRKKENYHRAIDQQKNPVFFLFFKFSCDSRICTVPISNLQYNRTRWQTQICHLPCIVQNIYIETHISKDAQVTKFNTASNLFNIGELVLDSYMLHCTVMSKTLFLENGILLRYYGALPLEHRF